MNLYKQITCPEEDAASAADHMDTHTDTHTTITTTVTTAAEE
jgi:hypothetical protein